MLVPFKATHLAGIDWVERERTYQIGFKRAFAAYESNPGWSLMHEGRFVAGGGIVIPYQGLGEAWLIAGPEAPAHSLTIVRACQSVLEDAHLLKLVRVQAMVMRHLEAGHRLMRVLGFQQECLVRKYGLHGADMYLYAMFPGETR